MQQDMGRCERHQVDRCVFIRSEREKEGRQRNTTLARRVEQRTETYSQTVLDGVELP